MTKKSKTIRVNHLLRLGICVALIALIVMIGAVMAGAEDVKYSEGLEFTSNGDGTCSVSGIGTCKDTEIVIPPVSPAGDTVTSIGVNAFNNKNRIKSVIIPKGVTTIENAAFYSCDSLTKVDIPEGVTSIDDHAFCHCANLIEITIPQGVTSIGSYAFGFCVNLIDITIPKSVIRVGNNAFIGCEQVYQTPSGLLYMGDWVVGYVTGITEATLRPTTVGIADRAFSNCESLTNITIPQSVTNIGQYAFYNCCNLQSVIIPENVTKIDDCTFWICRNLKSIHIPEGVTSIGAGAFSSCESLTYIGIPESVTKIGSSAFSGCKSLRTVHLPTGLTRIEDHLLAHCYGLTSFTIPENVTSIGDGAFNSCRGLTSINIPENVTSIGEGAFESCVKVTSIYIPQNVNSIGNSAFGFCYNLRQITVADGNIRYYSRGNCLIDTTSKTIIAGCRNSIIPKDGSVIHIGDYAFYGCYYLSSISIPECVISIGDYAFQACRNLTKIHIPKEVVYISSYALGCSNLSQITVAEGNPVYHSAGNCLIETASKTLVAGCYNSTIPVDGSVTNIGDYAFYAREKMTSIVIPESVISIGSKAFLACKELTSIVIPAGVKSIGDTAFSGCVNLKSFTIPEGVTNIGESTFNGCGSLETITIPKSVTSIGDSAFCDCESLTDIVIPDGVKYIGISAFRNCSSLASVTIPKGLKSINHYTFNNCSSLTSITIPHSVTSIEPYAFAGCESLTDVHFGATKNEWRRVTISEENDELLCATFHFLDDYFNLTSASITLGDSLTMNYYAKADPAYSDVKMRFTYRGRIESVRGVPTETEGEYVFSLKGIAPQCMGENIKAELIYVTEDGTEIVVDVKETYSIRQYCDDALAANPDNKALATLLADLLAYGDAAQSYTDFNADTPVSEGFEVAPSEWEDVTDTDFTLSDKTRDDIRFTSAGVRFGYVNRLYFKIKATDLTGVTLTVNGKTYTAEDLTLVEDTADTYILYTDPVYATEFDRVFTAELSADGRTVQTLTYSVKSYVYAKQNSENTEMAALVRALYAYGRSAIAYKQEQ